MRPELPLGVADALAGFVAAEPDAHPATAINADARAMSLVVISKGIGGRQKTNPNETDSPSVASAAKL